MKNKHKRILSLAMFIMLAISITGCDWYPKKEIKNPPDVFVNKYEISTTITEGEPMYPSIAWTGTEWGMVFVTDVTFNIYYVRFSKDSVRIGQPIRLVESNIDNRVNCPSIAWDGESFILTCVKHSDKDTIITTRFNKEGIVQLANNVQNPVGSSLTMDNEQPVPVVAGQDDYAIVKSDGGIEVYFMKKTSCNIAYSSNKDPIQSAVTFCSGFFQDGFVVIAKPDSGNFISVFMDCNGNTRSDPPPEIPVEINADSLLLLRVTDTEYVVGGMQKELRRLVLWQLSENLKTVTKETFVPCERTPEYFSLGYDGENYAFLWTEEGKGNIYFSN